MINRVQGMRYGFLETNLNMTIFITYFVKFYKDITTYADRLRQEANQTCGRSAIWLLVNVEKLNKKWNEMMEGVPITVKDFVRDLRTFKSLSKNVTSYRESNSDRWIQSPEC